MVVTGQSGGSVVVLRLNTIDSCGEHGSLVTSEGGPGRPFGAGRSARDGVRDWCRLTPLGCEVDCVAGQASVRTGAVSGAFGIGLQTRRVRLVDDVSVELGAGRILALVGPSGSGKSSALDVIAQRFPLACLVPRIRFAPGKAIVDQVGVGERLSGVVSLLTSCGLGDAQLWLRTADALSEGERYRAQLARGVSIVSRGGDAPLLCDEFGSHLDRTTGRAVSFNLRKLVSRRGLCLVVCCHRDELLRDLRPDCVVRFSQRGRCDVQDRTWRTARAVSFRRGLRVVRGGRSDYPEFASMHYRGTDELGFVDRVFVLRERSGGGALGIVVYSHGPLELALRNRATDGRFSRNPARLNRELRILRRLVIRPDVRGCGLGHYLVRKTLPLVGTKYVECLSAMGEFNPVFEKAGMRRVGQYAVSPRCRDAMARLRDLGVDPFGQDFPVAVARRRRVREVVSRVVSAWYAGTTGGGSRRVVKQSPAFLAQLFRGLVTSAPSVLN